MQWQSRHELACLDLVVAALGAVGRFVLLAKVALGALGPFTVVFRRVALGALPLDLVRPLRRDAPWRTCFAMGALNNAVSFALISWGPVTASSVLILPIMLILEPPWTLAVLPTSSTWAALAGLALLSTALAYFLYFRFLAAFGATNLLLVTFLVPVTAILLGSVFLHERLGARHTAGMALIGFGLARSAAASRV